MAHFHITHINLAHGFRGGERQTVLLIKALAKLNLMQCLICRKESPLQELLKNTPNLKIKAVANKPDARLLGHFFLRHKSDLIQAHETLAAQSAYLHHCLFKTPYVITRRVDDRIRNNAFNQGMYKNAAALVGVSSVIAKIMQDTFNVNALTIHSAQAKLHVDPKLLLEIKKSWEGSFVIGHIGALVDHHKGQSTLIEATKLLKDKIPNLKVVFLGDGPDKEQLQEQACDLPIEFLGFHKNVQNYLAGMNIFAFPSNHEGLGSTILDAMSLQVPVIASAVGGIPDLVTHESSGLLIKPHDAQALAQEILRLHADEKLKAQLISGGLEVAQKHTDDAMAYQYLTLYQSISSCFNAFNARHAN